MKDILITGFEPFGGETLNPSWELIRKDYADCAVELPTCYYRAMEPLKAAIAEHQPKAVLALGQAGGRSSLTIEKLGINWMQASIPDNDGVLLTGQKIDENGPDAYFSTLNIPKILAGVQGLCIPMSLSLSAGAFICNRVLYGLGQEAAASAHPFKFGFVHVPYWPCQTVDKPNQPSMDAATMKKALDEIIQIIKSEV